MSYIQSHNRNRPHWVYRLYDAEDRLLYVGCTVKHPIGRLQHLFAENPSIARAPFARLEAVPFADGHTAAIEEGRLIDFHQPPYNGARSAVALRREAGLPS